MSEDEEKSERPPSYRCDVPRKPKRASSELGASQKLWEVPPLEETDE